jgi:hypothetical protein
MLIIQKMKQIKTLSLQNWFDISIQYTGNVYNARAIATANNRSVTDVLKTGETITIPNGLPLSNKELQYFGARNLKPATAYLERRNDTEDYLFPNTFPILL